MNEGKRTRRTIRRCTAVLVLTLAVTAPPDNGIGIWMGFLAIVWLIVDYLVQWLGGGVNASQSKTAG